MDVLPDEVILTILSYLPHQNVVNISNVCRRLQELATNCVIWRNVKLSKDFTFKNYKEGFLASFFEKIGKHIKKLSVDSESSLSILLSEVSCGPYNRLTELDISACVVKSIGCYDPYDLILGGLRFPNLESISTVVSVKNIRQFQESFYQRKLKKIHLEFAKPWKRIRNNEDLDEFGFNLHMIEIIKDHPNLEHISIHCDMMKDVTVDMIFDSCETVTHLSLQKCISLTNACFNKMPSLNYLTYLNMDYTCINDVVVETLCNRCPMLKFLSLLQCYQLTENSIIIITTYCKYLQYFLFSAFRKAENVEIESYGSSLKMIENLKDLKLFAHQGNSALLLNDTILNGLCNCLNITELELCDCRLVTDEAASIIGHKLVKLKNLKLSNCYKIKSAVAEKILLGCNQLKVLKMDSCKTLKGLCFLEQGTGIHSHIQELSLTKTLQGEKELKNIATMCPDIRKLDLNQSKGITDVSLEVLMNKCNFLTYLNISQVNKITMQHHWNITDITMANISQCLPGLEYLNINGNYKVTCAGLKKVIQCCQSLKKIYFSIDIEDTVGIKSDEFYSMRNEMTKFKEPGLKWILNSKGAACIEFT